MIIIFLKVFGLKLNSHLSVTLRLLNDVRVCNDRGFRKQIHIYLWLTRLSRVLLDIFHGLLGGVFNYDGSWLGLVEGRSWDGH